MPTSNTRRGSSTSKSQTNKVVEPKAPEAVKTEETPVVVEPAVVETIITEQDNAKEVAVVQETQEIQASPAPEVSEAAIASVAQQEVKKVRIKFIKPHSFNIGIEKVTAKIHDILMVEPHIANKLVSRSIAYILG